MDNSFPLSRQDILAVGYGEFTYSDQKGGLACCWSIKNPEVGRRCDVGFVVPSRGEGVTRGGGGGEGRRGGVLTRSLGGGMPPKLNLNPDPISDLERQFSVPHFRRK